METLFFHGPHQFSEAGINELPVSAGIYLWCVPIKGSSDYRVHYVGEAANIRSRMRGHQTMQLAGKYHAFSPKDLKKNTKVLVHRAGEGVVSRSQESITCCQANSDYLDNLSIFFAELPTSNKNIRCQLETAIAHRIEDHGQNVLHVGHLRRKTDTRSIYAVRAGNCSIEALTDYQLEVGI